MRPVEDQASSSRNSTDEDDDSEGFITVVVHPIRAVHVIGLIAAVIMPLSVFWSTVVTLKGVLQSPILAGPDILSVLAAATGLTGVVVVIARKIWSVARATRIEIQVGDTAVTVDPKNLTKTDQRRLFTVMNKSGYKHL